MKKTIYVDPETEDISRFRYSRRYVPLVGRKLRRQLFGPRSRPASPKGPVFVRAQ